MFEKLLKKEAAPEKEVKKEEETLFKIELQHEIPTLPDFKTKEETDIRYPLIEPYAYAHIVWDSEKQEVMYKIEEPELNPREKEILRILEDGVKELINISFISMKEGDVVVRYLEKNLKVLLRELGFTLSKDTFLKIMYYIYRDFVGLNEIEPLMNDYFIEDIECNGIQAPLYIIHRKYRNLKTNISFDNILYLASFVEKLAQKCGRYVSYASPLLDGSLPSGHRVNATYTADVSSKGPTFCIADGYLQLNDGSVVDIKEFFEECKRNFPCKLEDGNEIVELNNLGCCGVDENTLEQFDSKLKSIIKLKPPESLVRIKLEDRSEITTTTNHLFHVVDEKLKLLEASNLKQEMFIPLPKKINVNGCLQTINVANILKEFSYHKKICVVTNTEIKSVVSNKISEFKQIYKNYNQELSNYYGVHNSYFYEILSRGNSISLEVLNKMTPDFNNLGGIGIVVYGGGTKNRSKTVFVPDSVDEDLAYLCGAIISDGHLSKDNIDISTYETGFRNAVIHKLLKKFGKYEIYYNGNRVYLCNSFVPFFFNKIFSIPYGKKANIVKIPEIIFKSDNQVVASFIRGLFDGDGSASSSLSYKTNSKSLVYGLTYLLARLGIYSFVKSSNNQYNLIIPAIYQKTYNDCIGFENLFKKYKLLNLIKKRDKIRSYIRYGRIPAKPVLDLLKQTNISKNKIIKLLKGPTYNRFYYNSFSRPFVQDIINIIKKEKDIDAGLLKEVESLVRFEQEYIKINSIEVIENKENIPVYDIELEPCKFFIAGNRPMNIFDTIRAFTKEPWSPPKMIELGTVSPEMLAYLWILVENEFNVMVVGGTGSGKTSFLNCIAFFIPQQARIVSIEDTRELNIEHENWLPSVAREGVGLANIVGQKYGEVTLFDLLKESFRQRPDYVIIGEVRGKEAFVLFQGMASGHPSMGTMHANDVQTMIRRLETEPINLSPSLVESMDAVCIMSQAKYKGKEIRRLKQIAEIISVPEEIGKAQINVPFQWDSRTDTFYFKTDSYIFQKLMSQHGYSQEHLVQEFDYRTKLLYELYKRKIFEFREVQKIIHEYARNPKKVLKDYGIIK